MEMIVNLLIIFVILVAIIKRMQDVAKKGGDITGRPSDPSLPAGGWPERPVREADVFTEEFPYEDEEEPYRETRPVESPRRSFSDKIYRFEEERKQMSFPSADTELTGEYQPVSEDATVRAARRSARSGKRAGKLCPALGMCESELVRGIILSEILGKPIALRHENRW
jgi:hypothetical protein